MQHLNSQDKPVWEAAKTHAEEYITFQSYKCATKYKTVWRFWCSFIILITYHTRNISITSDKPLTAEFYLTKASNRQSALDWEICHADVSHDNKKVKSQCRLIWTTCKIKLFPNLPTQDVIFLSLSLHMNHNKIPSWLVSRFIQSLTDIKLQMLVQ